MLHVTLAWNSALHCAVNWHSECNATLLEDGCDLKAMNMGGRTVMRTIAKNYGLSSHDTNRNSSYKISVDNADSVLQWTPICYATKSQNWSFVTWLLETIVDRSGLDMITKGTRSPLHWPNHQLKGSIRSRVTSWVFIQYQCEHSLANL